ncbi:MAG: serine hydrolase domain-containing protein [Steroidobacteraceae bacterium]
MNRVSESLAVGRANVPISGFVAPGYETVLEAFKRNFIERRELGAACSAYVSGRCVVDLWGGSRAPDRDEPWHDDTMALVMSTTKGLSAMTLAIAHSRGLFDYDAPVGEYWPEFAQNGKAKVTVAQLLAHQAGVCAIDTPMTLELLSDPDALAVVLARQRPAWEPGTRHGYHAITLGLYQSELLRRVDPKHRTLGVFFQEEVANKLGGGMHIGLPKAVPDSQLAGLRFGRDIAAAFTLPLRLILDAFNPASLLSRIARNPKVRRIREYSTRPYLQIELPSVNGVGTARAIAHAYGVFAFGGAELGVKRGTLERLERPASIPSLGPADAVYRIDFAYSHGFCKPFPFFPFSNSTRAYGTPGAGGSQGFADPETELGFAYVPNSLLLGAIDDKRAVALRHAIYSCVRK